MKYITLTLLIYFFIPGMGLSQQTKNYADNLLEVTKKGIVAEANANFDEHARQLIIGDIIIPVSKTTKVKRRKYQGNQVVEFRLQEGTAITSKDEPNLRKAWFLLEFKSKKSAKSFVKLFKKMTQENG
ncbi:hypothetical protein [Fodinibius sp. SL11]|uniref:hypothetical protein n=1 Tax=Fodinibius sp. SL11 TaxID=3425690 RepID=UPI003F88255B